VRNAVVGVDIGHDDMGLVEHRPTRNAGLERKTFPLPQRGDRVFVGVITVAALPEDERYAIGFAELARRLANDGAHGRFVTRRGERRDCIEKRVPDELHDP
jgi:hypothetical protein